MGGTMKRRILSSVLALLFVVALLPLSGRADTVHSGDVDNDGAVTLKDAAIVARHVAGWNELLRITCSE